VKILIAAAVLLAGCGSDVTIQPGGPNVGVDCAAQNQFQIMGGTNGGMLNLFVELQSDFGPTEWKEAWVTDVMGADLIRVTPMPGQQPMGQPQFQGQAIEIILGFGNVGAVPDPTSGTFLLHSLLLANQDGISSSSCQLVAQITFNVNNGAVSAGYKLMPQ
jgi:hypothetical protein